MLTSLRNTFLLLFFLSDLGFTKVTPPNYDFSLDQFTIFMPGSSLADIEKKYKTKELMFKEGNFKTYKFQVDYLRYNFAILVQFKSDIVTDFHARLPQYFLHDIFHQSLINRLGAQDVYKKSEEQAIYIWKNKKGFKHIYSGACTITCFPIYYNVLSAKKITDDSYVPLIKKINEK